MIIRVKYINLFDNEDCCINEIINTDYLHIRIPYGVEYKYDYILKKLDNADNDRNTILYDIHSINDGISWNLYEMEYYLRQIRINNIIHATTKYIFYCKSINSVTTNDFILFRSSRKNIIKLYI